MEANNINARDKKLEMVNLLIILFSSISTLGRLTPLVSGRGALGFHQEFAFALRCTRLLDRVGLQPRFKILDC